MHTKPTIRDIDDAIITCMKFGPAANDVRKLLAYLREMIEQQTGCAPE